MSGLSKYDRYRMAAAYKHVKGKGSSEPNLAWYEENIDVDKHVGLENIWVDSGYIPDVAPELEVDGKYTVTEGTVTLNILQKLKVTLSKVDYRRNCLYSADFTEAIEGSFGEGYNLILEDADGNRIPFGLNKWMTDGEAGYVTFLDGIPSDSYALPYTLTFYKYIGRRGNEGILTSSGAEQMLGTYSPTEDQQVATKKYVDSNLSDVNELLLKIVPHTPDTFEGKDLTITSAHRKGRLCTTTDEYVDVIYNTGTLSMTTDPFYNVGYGTVTLYCGNYALYSQDISSMVAGEGTVFHINGFVDPYEDDFMGDGVYTCIDMTINLDIQLQVIPWAGFNSAPYATYQLAYSVDDVEQFRSNTLKIGIDYTSPTGYLQKCYLNNFVTAGRYISGVPALVAGDTMTYNVNFQTIKRFCKDTVGTITYGKDNVLTEDIPTNSTYSDYSPIHTYTKDLYIPEGIYTESWTISGTVDNLDGQNGSNSWNWNIRVDSVSDESIRVTSPDSNGNNYGYAWTEEYQQRNQRYYNDLMMLNGEFMWPQGDFSANGTISDFSSDYIVAGPDYDSDVAASGVRYVTFKYDIDDYVNGFYISFIDPVGITSDSETNVWDVKVLKCKVDSTDEEDATEWLDMLTPFDGVGSPEDFDDRGCHVIDRSTDTVKYETFGQHIVKGTLYVTVGFGYDRDFRFKGMNVEFDK